MPKYKGKYTVGGKKASVKRRMKNLRKLKSKSNEEVSQSTNVVEAGTTTPESDVNMRSNDDEKNTSQDIVGEPESKSNEEARPTPTIVESGTIPDSDANIRNDNDEKNTAEDIVRETESTLCASTSTSGTEDIKIAPSAPGTSESNVTDINHEEKVQT